MVLFEVYGSVGVLLLFWDIYLKSVYIFSVLKSTIKKRRK